MTMAKAPDPRLMHIHGQRCPRGEAFVVANRAALTALRDALDAIIKSPQEGIAAWQTEFMASDGESFGLVIVADDSAWSSPTWRKAALPYSASYAREGRADVLWPSKIAQDRVRLLADDWQRAKA